MVEIKLLDIIQYRQFGILKLGDSKQKVLDFLGEPDGYSNPELNPGFYDAILYDRWELNFRNDQLNSIQHAYILDLHSWRFNRKFHYSNGHFKLTSWIKQPRVDTQIKSFIKKMEDEGLEYNLFEYLDSMKMTVGDNIEILFSSKESFHKDPSVWRSIEAEVLDFRFSHFFFYQPLI